MATNSMSPFIKALCFALLIFTQVPNLQAQSNKWVGTWATAPYAAGKNTPPVPYLANNTLRQIVRVSVGGEVIKVKFSNVTGKSNVELKKDRKSVV